MTIKTEQNEILKSPVPQYFPRLGVQVCMTAM